MTKRKVAFVELTVFAGVYPLASGYLQAAACQRQEISENFEFETHSFCLNQPGFEENVKNVKADIYCFSCYVWNTGFIKRWIVRLLEEQPGIEIILGGPQVMNKGERYLLPMHENLVICNGEGEYTFTNYLLEIVQQEPDLSKVKGLSFYRNGKIVTTPEQEEIEDINVIPSPYLGGYFKPEKYVWALLETNRGCPFTCTYCFWGAATSARVRKAALERVKDEITWLSEKRAMYLFITDANFGMFERDVEIARHIAHCKSKNGYPMTVYLSASKNTHKRVTEITKILSDAGLISVQPVSLQTLDAKTLECVKRGNIKESSYIELQNELRKNRISSFIEMIWPLPGETLESFMAGIEKLCRLGADAFVIHNLLLINNVEMEDQQQEFGIKVIDDVDPNSEAKIVVGTRDVSTANYQDGVRLGYHITSLYSARGLRYTARFLDSGGVITFSKLITAFNDYCKANSSNPYSRYIESVLAASKQTKFSSNGGIFHVALHAHRREFDELLYDFLKAMKLLESDRARFMFELDLLNRPYVYSNTPIAYSEGLFEIFKILEKQNNSLVVRVREEFLREACELLELPVTNEDLTVKYRALQMPFMTSRPLDENLSYCEAKLHKMDSIMPYWSFARDRQKVARSLGASMSRPG